MWNQQETKSPREPHTCPLWKYTVQNVSFSGKESFNWKYWQFNLLLPQNHEWSTTRVLDCFHVLWGTYNRKKYIVFIHVIKHSKNTHEPLSPIHLGIRTLRIRSFLPSCFLLVPWPFLCHPPHLCYLSLAAKKI